MVRLTYTSQMKEQDKLWRHEMEDTETMRVLFETLYQEAKSKGFTGIVDIHMGTNEMCADVYASEEQKENMEDEANEWSFGYCLPLMKCLESIINDG